MKNFPFLSFPQAMLLLRVAIAVMFMAHAITRIANGTIPRFAGFLEDKGFIYGMAVVWAITVVEIVCGSLLIIGKHTRWAAAGLMAKLQALLVAVGTQPGPAVLMEGMTVQILTYATNQAPARLTGQINFFVLRSAS